jgi:DNA-binding transcriptional LysR family regulator
MADSMSRRRSIWLHSTLRPAFRDDDVKCLDEAAKLGSMRAAAEHLNVEPSSISRRIAKLEGDVGLPLVEKGRHKIQLTEAGQLVCEYYRTRLSERQELLNSLDDFRSHRKGAVTVAGGEGFVMDILTPALAAFTETHPDVFIAMHTSLSVREVMGMVIEDQAHFGLVFDPEDDPRIRRRMSIEQPLKAIVPWSNPLSRRKSVCLRDLQGHRLCLSQSVRLNELFFNAQKHEGVQLKCTLASSSIALLREYVARGTGITIMSDISFTRELLEKRVVSVPIENPILKASSAAIITRARRQLPPTALALLRTVESHMAQWQKLFAYGKTPAGKERGTLKDVDNRGAVRSIVKGMPTPPSFNEKDH